ncbi:MAG: Rrf2 family transcriptional regulator [Planctomycetota bacterium]|nr:MAG: Rrf2 family transcriptional regulator [Planctomycetota bacterium]
MLSQAVGYAAAALGFMAVSPDRGALVREIAQACDIPPAYLSKIINQLARAGLVKTQRGVGGGAKLSREGADITLFDLCVALNDPAIQQRCMLGIADCTDERGCPAHEFNTERRSCLIRFLKETTVQDIGIYERNANGAKHPSRAAAG